MIAGPVSSMGGCADCAEMNHRVANNLASLASLIELDSRSVADPAASWVLETARRRIQAIGHLHGQLCLATRSDQLNAAHFLHELRDALRDVFTGERQARAISVRAEPLVLSVEHAAAIGVVVAELVSNACRHAYPNEAPGEIRIILAGRSAPSWRLTVEDDGIGMSDRPRSPTAGTGLGRRIIEATSQRLGLRHWWEPTDPGTRFILQTG